MEFKNGKIYWMDMDISERPIRDWMFIKDRFGKKEKSQNYVLLEDRDEALWWIYVNNELVELYRCAFEYEAKNRLNEILDRMEEMDYEAELACRDLEGEFEF